MIYARFTSTGSVLGPSLFVSPLVRSSNAKLVRDNVALVSSTDNDRGIFLLPGCMQRESKEKKKTKGTDSVEMKIERDFMCTRGWFEGKMVVEQRS